MRLLKVDTLLGLQDHSFSIIENQESSTNVDVFHGTFNSISQTVIVEHSTVDGA